MINQAFLNCSNKWIVVCNKNHIKWLRPINLGNDFYFK